MPPKSRWQRFEELGLLNKPEVTNPYADLGLAPEFVRSLLTEDPTGAGLRAVTGGLARVLSRRYHPDNQDTGSSERFRAIGDADKRIELADLSALSRWATVERTATSSVQLEKAKAEQQEVISRASEMFKENLRYSLHPQHYAQLPWTQGLLLERDRSMILVRQLAGGGIRSVQGRVLGADRVTQSAGFFGFDGFMRKHESFGLEPNTPITTYVDETGRATILDADLRFLMDITAPVAKYRELRKKLTRLQKMEIGSSDGWTRATDPLLFHTNVPEPRSKASTPAQITRFPAWVAEPRKSHSMTRDISLEVVGSFASQSFFNRLRHSKNAGAAAIEGAAASENISYFNTISVKPEQFLENDSGYSPLIKSGSSVLLYDPRNDTPVITDATIIGMIGSDPHAE